MSYNKAWKKYKTGHFTLIEFLVVIFIISIVLVMIAVGLFVILGGCKAYKAVSEDGLESSVERVWEGPEKSLEAPETTPETSPEEVDNNE